MASSEPGSQWQGSGSWLIMVGWTIRLAILRLVVFHAKPDGENWE